MKKINIGIVGAGAIAQRNAQEAANAGIGDVIGVFDVNHKVARDMAKRLSAKFYSSYEEMLDVKELDAVLISTPHFLHESQAIMAAEKKKHILIEKPMSNTVAEANNIIKACKKNNVKIAVNYSFRFLPKIQQARKLVMEGALGEITGAQILGHQFKDPGYWTGARSNSPDDWRASREKSGGGLLIMTTCHAIDYIYFITGLKATRVYCEYDTLNSSAEVEDIFSISFRFENGAIGSVNASSIMRGTEQAEERIWGTKGTIILNNDGLFFYSTRPVMNKKPGKLYKLTKFPSISWTADWVRNFAESIHENTDPAISHKEGWENIAFISSAYDSLKKEKSIIIPKYEDVFGNGR
jgi:predicted dehydrogenase